MDFIEGMGESSSPPLSAGSSGGGGGSFNIRNEVYNRLLESASMEESSNPELLREQLEAHFDRLPSSYMLDINMHKVEDVLLHQKLLTRANNPDKRPVVHVRYLENIWTKADDTDVQDILKCPSTSKPHFTLNDDEGTVPSRNRHRDNMDDFEACSKLKDLNLGNPAENIIRREAVSCIPIHEVIFSTIDKPKLLSQLSALLSNIGLNIREAHVFSTTDGYSLDVFAVDGWPVEDPKGMLEELEKAIGGSEGLWSGSSHSAQVKFYDWGIDRGLLKIDKMIASGSCGDLYKGVYNGLDVAVKILKPENLTDSLKAEFAQEVYMLRQVQHENVVRFIGACSKSQPLCIVTEYMPGGSLYDYLHSNPNTLNLSQILRFAIDICKGMEYLHQNNIIHRDLKAANLLIDADKVVKVADFGIARFLSKGGTMTAETGTYRWMAPEIINHQPYDQKADIFSFAIVLWELATSKIPYTSMTPLQAAIGVRQGLRPELPIDLHPKLLELMQRCWERVPGERPSFSEIRAELEQLLKELSELP